MPDPSQKEVREMPDWVKDFVKDIPLSRNLLESDVDYRKRQIEHEAGSKANESINRLVDGKEAQI